MDKINKYEGKEAAPTGERAGDHQERHEINTEKLSFHSAQWFSSVYPIFLFKLLLIVNITTHSSLFKG